VIVEGPSDRDALEIPITRIFNRNEVKVHVEHGDVTSEQGANARTILAKLGEIIEKFEGRYSVKRRDFQEIIHIVDMDGAYIPDSAVVKDLTAENPIYSLQEIRTKNVTEMIERNMRKQNCLNRLSTRDRVSSIPYKIYYMSSNLDHVLYDKLNSSDEEKENDSRKFSTQYNNDIKGFINFMADSPFSVKMPYKESWEFIKEEKHSLERYTNFGICLTNSSTD